MIDLKREHFAELNEGKKTTHSIQEFTGALGKLLTKINVVSMIKVSDIELEYHAAGFYVRTKFLQKRVDIMGACKVITENTQGRVGANVAIVGKELVLQLAFYERGVDALTY